MDSEDHYSRAEGHCIVVAETPVKYKDTAGGRDFYAEIKMEPFGKLESGSNALKRLCRALT